MTAVGDRPYRIAAKNVSDQPKWHHYFTNFNPPFVDLTSGDYTDYLEKAGFNDLHVYYNSPIEDIFYFADPKSLIPYLSTWLPQLSCLYAGTKEELVKDPMGLQTGGAEPPLETLSYDFCSDVVQVYCDIIKWDDK